MYLKQIKLVGFKSFADQTIFQLEPGITGIVGPNGTGKSNIVDAVRWVLGEQKIKSLRGATGMTDVIFSGSKSRKPASAAAVTLVFNNEDNFFPLPYTEIALKRVIYQTGESEYYLNGESCRLKDINDLIIDTGLAKESFNIITQGNVQAILSNKPEERRIIFEEAAGVLKYKKRKEEAFRKLERTYDNIKRINDIIKELEQQLEPLKEQKAKACRYQEVKQELRETEISLMVQEIENANYEYKTLKQEIETGQETFFEFERLRTTEDTLLMKIKVELTKTNEILAKAQQELLAKTALVEKLNGEQKLLRERKKYDGDHSHLNDNALILKEKELKIKATLATNNLELERKQEYLVKLEEKNQVVTAELTRLLKEEEALLKVITNQNRLQNELNYKQGLLKENIAEQQYLPPAVRTVLTCPRLEGVHNTIGGLITMPEQYQTCIEIALGSSMQFLVVNNEEVAKDCINYLKQQKGGRATFFPLNIIKPRYLDQNIYNLIKEQEAFVDLASNLVSYEDKYKAIILNQLGTVIVAKTLEGANQISKLINYRYRVVTLEGELLNIGGAITGGVQKWRHSIFSLEAELNKIKGELAQSNRETERKQLKLKELKLLIQTTQQQDYNLKIERGSFQQQIELQIKLIKEQESELSEIETELKGINHILTATLEAGEQELMTTYYKAQSEKESANQEVNYQQALIKDLNEQINTSEIKLKRLNQNLVKTEKENQNLIIKHNRLEVKLDNLLNYLNEEYKMTFERAQQEYILNDEVAGAQARVLKLKEIIKELGLVNLGAVAEFERLNERYEFLTTQRDDLYKAEVTLRKVIKEMDTIMQELFLETFALIEKEFKKVFKQLFGGGTAALELLDNEQVLTTGIEIKALPPGKKLQHISLLSGGEKALTAIALLFSILKVRPVPFCLLDEVEAPLDEHNVINFSSFLKELETTTQFILITHHKKTMEAMDVLYGITMQESGVSKLVSVKLKDKA